MRLKWSWLLMLAVVPAWAGLSPKTVPYVDLPRYMGTWYEIARTPNTFQKACVRSVSAHYVLLPDQQVQGINYCVKDNGERYQLAVKGKVQDSSQAKLLFKVTSGWVSWIPMLSADYWIIDLAEDYSHAAVATADGQYLWILARQPQLPDITYNGIVRRVARQGLAVDKLVRNQL